MANTVCGLRRPSSTNSDKEIVEILKGDDVGIVADAGAGAEIGTEAEAEAETGTQAEAEVEAEAETGTEAEAEAEAEAETGTGAERTEAKVIADAETGVPSWRVRQLMTGLWSSNQGSPKMTGFEGQEITLKETSQDMSPRLT
jgi:hypothetical protein